MEAVAASPDAAISAPRRVLTGGGVRRASGALARSDSITDNLRDLSY